MYLGGLQGDASSEYSPTFTPRDIASMSGVADILITSEAPENIDSLSSKPLGKTGSPVIATLVQKINPRYHFASEDIFYEREPYENGRGGYTRFLSLGEVGGDRWYYAFRINVNATVEKTPQGATANPFKKRQLESEGRTCRICGHPSHLSYDCPQKKDQKRKKRKRVIGRTFPHPLPFVKINWQQTIVFSVCRMLMSPNTSSYRSDPNSISPSQKAHSPRPRPSVFHFQATSSLSPLLILPSQAHLSARKWKSIVKDSSNSSTLEIVMP